MPVIWQTCCVGVISHLGEPPSRKGSLRAPLDEMILTPSWKARIAENCPKPKIYLRASRGGASAQFLLYLTTSVSKP